MIIIHYNIYNTGKYGSIEEVPHKYAVGYWGEQIFWIERNK